MRDGEGRKTEKKRGWTLMEGNSNERKRGSIIYVVRHQEDCVLEGEKDCNKK